MGGHMTTRAIYIWKLGPVVAAEGSVTKVVEKARRARISALWVKIADGGSPYTNVTVDGRAFAELIARCADKGIEVHGWHVPHCTDKATVGREVAAVAGVLEKLPLAGLIMDAEGGGAFFQGGKDEADAYGAAMRALANKHGIGLAISSNDIPGNLDGWLPKFNKIASHATVNFPQVYYGGSPSVLNRLERAEAANAHVTLPFAPVGAGWIGGDGGCASGSACAERAAAFIALVHKRGYPLYSFWHWGGAPLAFWEVLNTTPP